MTWPFPTPGLVVRYAYLWRSEANLGREEGRKDRPCAVVLAIKSDRVPTRVFVLPITHSEPRGEQEGIELPTSIKAKLGLDSARSWVIVSEANDFGWPGPDLRSSIGAEARGAGFGHLPPRFFQTVRQRFLANARSGKLGRVTRTT